MMNRIRKNISIIIFMMLAFILGEQCASLKKEPKENIPGSSCEAVALEERSTKTDTESVYNGRTNRNALQPALAGNIFFAEMEVYKDILAEYELAESSVDEIYIPERWKYVDQQMFYLAKEGLYYSMADLSGNGHPKLIIGTIETIPEDHDWEDPIYVSLSAVPRPGGAAEYYIRYIYSYDEKDGIDYIECGGNMMTIYEGGIIEQSRASNFYFYQYQENSRELEYLDSFRVEAEIQDREVKSRSYYRSAQDDSRSEIPESEYWECMDQYTSKPMKLKWLPVEGFVERSVMSGNKYFDEMEAYKIVLMEYECAQKNRNEMQEFHKGENVSDLLLHMSERKTLYYSIADLTGDGHMELVMGVIMKEEQENAEPLRITPKLSKCPAGTEYYAPWVIYSYSEEYGIVRSCERGDYEMAIYEDGIIEMSRAWHTYYYQYQKESGDLKFLDHFKVKAQVENGKVISRAYYRITQDEVCTNVISEEKYWEYVERYTCKPMELEWLPAEGFCG